MGGYQWTQKRTGVHTFVITCGDGLSPMTFYAAQSGTGVVSSTDGGNTWTAVGTGFPTGIGRTTLGALPADPSVLYALVQVGVGFGFYRLDVGSGAWQSVGGIPVLGSQSDYNLALIVDPNDVNTVYMAGSGGSLTYSVTSTFIGLGVHRDVHALQFTPGDSTALWACCDGGVFQTATANTAGTFFHRNTGLATACGTFFTQHPTQPAVIVLGLQDNGTARYTGEECWTHVEGGDGGYSIINWADPNRVLVYATGAIYLATDGGQSVSSFSTIASPPSGIMAEPLVTTPYNPGSLVDAETVAFSSSTSVFISTDFGATWGSAVATLPQNVFALTFALPNRLFAGTTLGQVYRLDGPSWTATRIDLVAAGSLLVSGIVTDIEVDPADATLQSVYITMGGFGDQRHVWYFDGSQWQSRSGFGATGLLDVETNAIVADPLNPATLYVGTDVGVWISTTGGSSWSPFESGLPDSAVFDLQIHPTTRLLRASTYGRGMFEIDLDPPVQADTELYVRDTALDVGRASTIDGLPDPEVWPTQPVWHFQSRNIKVDVPTTAGYQTITSDIDFLIFNDIIQDGSSQTATLDPTVATVVNRVYVEVHNRGIVEAPTVQVMLLLGNASMGLPDLPAGYESNVQSGMPISTALWLTVGIKNISNLNVAFPQVVSFQLPSTMLPPPASLPGQAHFCLLALLHTSPGDPYTNTEVVTDTLTINDRKVALRNLHIVEFIGTPPPPRSGTWQRIDLYGRENDRCAKELVISGVFFTGRFVMLLPPSLEVTRVTGMKDCERESFVDEWADKQTNHLRSFMKRGRFNYRARNQMLLDIRQVGGGRVFSAETEQGLYGVLSGICPRKGKRYPIFIYFEPAKLSFGQAQPVSIVVKDIKTGLVEGGSTYNIALVKDDGNGDDGKGYDGKGDD